MWYYYRKKIQYLQTPENEIHYKDLSSKNLVIVIECNKFKEVYIE